jgi:hypothetical protein
MYKGDKIQITQELLDDLERSSGLSELSTPQDLEDVLKLDKAIIYFLVDWSGPERLSRYAVYSVLNELKNEGTPVFKIDCSDQKKKYVEDWLTGQRESKRDFYYGGWGETILISKGQIIDVIANPSQVGLIKTKEKIKEWKNN